MRNVRFVHESQRYVSGSHRRLWHINSRAVPRSMMGDQRDQAKSPYDWFRFFFFLNIIA